MHIRPLYPIPAHSSTDWLAIANHVFVLASCGYIIGNFYRSIVGDSLNAAMSEDVENGLFLVLAAMFVVDSYCYYKCMFVAVWPVMRPRRLVEADEQRRRQQEAEEADDEEEVDDEVRALPWLSVRGLPQRGRTISGASISTTVSQEGEITPGLSPTSSDGWSDASAAGGPRTAGTDLSSSSTQYTLQVDTLSLSHPPSTAASVNATSDDVEENEELMVDPSYSALLPLRSAGLGELVNIVASLVALTSAILPFFSSYLTVPAQPPRHDMNLTPKYQLILDNGSMLLWFIDSLIYMHAWRHSLPSHYPGIKPSYFQPLHAYFWANLLNVLASGVYVVSVLYGFVYTHSESEWRDEDRLVRRQVMQMQRTLALGGDVLYLVCALLMEAAWYSDKCDEEVTELKRQNRRDRRRLRQLRQQRQRRKEQVPTAGQSAALPSAAVDSLHETLLADEVQHDT